MNEILPCDWLPKQARCSFHACLGLLAASCEKHFPNSHIINPLLTKFVRSRLAGYWPCSCFFLQVYGLQLRLSSFNMQKRTCPISSKSWPHTWSITHIYCLRPGGIVSVVCFVVLSKDVKPLMRDLVRTAKWPFEIIHDCGGSLFQCFSAQLYTIYMRWHAKMIWDVATSQLELI